MGTNAGRQVAVVGGGIGGLTAALAFARQNADVTVFEQAPALLEVGAGLQITPNGARALNALGLADRLAQSSILAEAVVPRDGTSGRDLARFDLSAEVPGYRFFHRAELLDLLVDVCRGAGVEFRLGERVSMAKGRLALKTEATEADLIVAADGLHSVARAVLNEPKDPFFTGQVAWRAIISGEHPTEAHIWMAPGRHLVSYPLTGNRINLVAVEERSAWAEEGWYHPDDPQAVQAAFEGCCGEVRGLLDRITDVHLWGLFRHPVAARWHCERMALVGDAAHPTLPFLAQGANLAIEDAYLLAKLTDKTRDISKALAEYQRLRKARVGRAIAAANANARNYHLSGIQRSVAHLALGFLDRVAPNAYRRRLGWLYDFDVTA